MVEAGTVDEVFNDPQRMTMTLGTLMTTVVGSLIFGRTPTPHLKRKLAKSVTFHMPSTAMATFPDCMRMSAVGRFLACVGVGATCHLWKRS